MHLFKHAERVLGITCNQFNLKNALSDNLALYESIKQFKKDYNSNFGSYSIDDQWSKVSCFISLLYAKALNINEEEDPTFYWNQKNGLLKKQFQLATSINLIVEANNLSIMEYNQMNKPTMNSLSTKLYFKSLDIVKQLDNERIYIDLKQSINNFHLGINKWSKFEEIFFSQNDDQTTSRLTFENYSDYVILRKDQNQLIRNWEEYIGSTYANLLGFACSSMSLLGNHNYTTYKISKDFGTNFAFNYVNYRQFINYSNGQMMNDKTLQLPIIMHLKLIKDDEKRKEIIEKIKLMNRQSSITNLKSEIQVNDETFDRIQLYGQNYLKQCKNCLQILNESNSKHALLKISDSLQVINNK